MRDYSSRFPLPTSNIWAELPDRVVVLENTFLDFAGEATNLENQVITLEQQVATLQDRTSLIPTQELKIRMFIDGNLANIYYNKGFTSSIFVGISGNVFDVTLGSGFFGGFGNTEVFFQLYGLSGYTIIPTVIGISGTTISYTLAAIDNFSGGITMLDSSNSSSYIQGYITVIIKQ
jgi:hypothetical protein